MLSPLTTLLFLLCYKNIILQFKKQYKFACTMINLYLNIVSVGQRVFEYQKSSIPFPNFEQYYEHQLPTEIYYTRERFYNLFLWYTSIYWSNKGHQKTRIGCLREDKVNGIKHLLCVVFQQRIYYFVELEAFRNITLSSDLKSKIFAKENVFHLKTILRRQWNV